MGSSENLICMPRAINRPGLFLCPRNIANRDAVVIVAIHRDSSRHSSRFITIRHMILPRTSISSDTLSLRRKEKIKLAVLMRKVPALRTWRRTILLRINKYNFQKHVLTNIFTSHICLDKINKFSLRKVQNKVCLGKITNISVHNEPYLLHKLQVKY